jgi:hypothetical protein
MTTPRHVRVLRNLRIGEISASSLSRFMNMTFTP